MFLRSGCPLYLTHAACLSEADSLQRNPNHVGLPDLERFWRERSLLVRARASVSASSTKRASQSVFSISCPMERWPVYPVPESDDTRDGIFPRRQRLNLRQYSKVVGAAHWYQLLATSAGFEGRSIMTESSCPPCSCTGLHGKMGLQCQEVIIGILLHVGFKIPHDHHVRALVLLKQGVKYFFFFSPLGGPAGLIFVYGMAHDTKKKSTAVCNYHPEKTMPPSGVARLQRVHGFEDRP